MSLHPRWVGVGESAATASECAGAEARAAAVDGRADAKLLIVFASAGHDLGALLDGIDPGEVPLVGCSTAGEIGSRGPGDRGVVVMALGGDDLAGDQQEIVRGAYDVAGSVVPLVGGCAGDDLAMTGTFQLYGTEVLQDAVVGVAIGSDAPLGIGVQHGWRRVGEPVLVSKSAGNRVLSLDDRPALDVYLERLGAPQAAYCDPATFTRFALTHPLGLGRRSGEDHVRFVGEADFLDRSLGCIAEVPQGAVAYFMEGDAHSVLQATEAACHGALAPLGERPPLGVLAFDCIARRGVLGDAGIAEEVERITAVCGGSPVAGFYTNGEIARTRGISGFHNQTLVVLALG